MYINTAIYRRAERYQRSEKALVLALQEIYLPGVSTHKVQAITEKLCRSRFSKDQVSALSQALDEELERWRRRPVKKSHCSLAKNGVELAQASGAGHRPAP
jgi:transposase-like protein